MGGANTHLPDKRIIILPLPIVNKNMDIIIDILFIIVSVATIVIIWREHR